MKHRTFYLALLLILVTACAPRVNDPAEFITVNKQHELMLLGSWQLTQLRDGTVPLPNQTRTLTFQNDGSLKMDLWEHELTYKYEVMPDPDHLRLTLTASTNPNDKPGAVTVQALVVSANQIVLDGDEFRRTATASGPTVAPATATMPPTPQAADTPTAPATTTTSGARLDEDFALHVGETAMLTDSPDQFGITFYNVKQDSRCPQGVTCVWAGEVRVEITFQEHGILHPPILELTTNAADARHIVAAQDYLVQVVKVLPPKLANAEIAPHDYVVTFRVTRAAATPTPEANVMTSALDQPVTLKMFQKVVFPQIQLQVTLNGVLEESRCPKQVNCAQAGRAILSFLLERNQRLGMFGLSTSPPDGTLRAFFQGYVVELLNVAPYPETVNQQIPTTAYSATIVVRKNLPTASVKKNEGFVLQVGQTATVADEDVLITFEKVASDSRCAYGVMCAVRGNAVVQATLTQADGTQQRFVFNTDSDVPNERIPDTGVYELELAALAPYPRVDVSTPEIAPDEYEATFVLHKFASPVTVPTKTPTPARPTACAGFASTDAEAILGEAVEPQPIAAVKIEAVAFDDESQDKATGLCGYVSAARTDKGVDGAGEPRLGTGNSAAAVTADRLSGVKVLELLRVANIIRGANPDGDTTPYLILKTRLAAGDWSGVTDTFQQLTTSRQVHFDKMQGMGDEALWVWRDARVNSYAALMVRDHDSFRVVEALLNKRMNESAAKEAIFAAMQKIAP